MTKAPVHATLRRIFDVVAREAEQIRRGHSEALERAVAQRTAEAAV